MFQTTNQIILIYPLLTGTAPTTKKLLTRVMSGCHWQSVSFVFSNIGGQWKITGELPMIFPGVSQSWDVHFSQS